jgi:hypothetical protein
MQSTQKVAVTFEISEFGVGQVYVLADNDEQASAGYRVLADVTPELRALSEACVKAATKIQASA